MKTKKSVSKRIRVTKTGKIVRRSMGVNHFKSRKNGNAIRQKRKTTGINQPKRALVNYSRIDTK